VLLHSLLAFGARALTPSSQVAHHALLFDFELKASLQLNCLVLLHGVPSFGAPVRVSSSATQVCANIAIKDWLMASHLDEMPFPCAQPSGRRSASPKFTPLPSVEFSNYKLSEVTTRLLDLQGPCTISLKFSASDTTNSFLPAPSPTTSPPRSPNLPASIPLLRDTRVSDRSATLLVGVQFRDLLLPFIESGLRTEGTPLLREVFAQIKNDGELARAIRAIAFPSRTTVFTGIDQWQRVIEVFDGNYERDFRSMPLEPVVKLSDILDTHRASDVRVQPCRLSAPLLQWKMKCSLQDDLIFSIYIIDDNLVR
jgi:hypothetical protein